MLMRQQAGNWRREVPGVRWFKADLHVQTIDDWPGGKAKMPSGLAGDPQDPEVISAYARRFLQSAVERGVQALGVTPHSPISGTGAETSAVWRIVEEWNGGIDDDGNPFREKVYAVFPGRCLKPTERSWHASIRRGGGRYDHRPRRGVGGRSVTVRIEGQEHAAGRGDVERQGGGNGVRGEGGVSVLGGLNDSGESCPVV